MRQLALEKFGRFSRGGQKPGFLIKSGFVRLYGSQKPGFRGCLTNNKCMTTPIVR